MVVAHPEDAAGPRDLVALHVDRVLPGARTGTPVRAVLQGEGTRVVVGAPDPVRRTVMDHAVAYGPVVRLAEDAAALPAAYLEALEDHVVRALELDRVVAAFKHRTRAPPIAPPPHHQRLALAAAIIGLQHDASRVDRVAVHLHHVPGSERVVREHVGQAGVVTTTARRTDAVYPRLQNAWRHGQAGERQRPGAHAAIHRWRSPRRRRHGPVPPEQTPVRPVSGRLKDPRRNNTGSRKAKGPTGMDPLTLVRSFWRARKDSNLRPPSS